MTGQTDSSLVIHLASSLHTTTIRIVCTSVLYNTVVVQYTATVLVVIRLNKNPAGINGVPLATCFRVQVLLSYFLRFTSATADCLHFGEEA